jgi:hypothetical protein
MASLSATGENAQLREKRGCTGENAAPKPARVINGTYSDCRRCLWRQVQEARLRQGEPLERAIVDRAQNPFAGLHKKRSGVMHHAMRKESDSTLVASIRFSVGRRVRILRRVLMWTVVARVVLSSLMQPRVQFGTDACDREQDNQRRS